MAKPATSKVVSRYARNVYGRLKHWRLILPRGKGSGRTEVLCTKVRFAVKVDGRLTKDWIINGFLWVAWELKAFSALSSVYRIFLTSCSSSGNSCCVYSLTVFQPNSNFLGKRVGSCFSSRRRVPWAGASCFIHSIHFKMRLRFLEWVLNFAVKFILHLVPFSESWTLRLNLYCISFPFQLKDLHSSRGSFLNSRRCSSVDFELKRSIFSTESETSLAIWLSWKLIVVCKRLVYEGLNALGDIQCS